MAYRFQNISILLVEDNQPMTELIRSLLTVFGVGEIICVKNGREGFDQFVAHGADLILTDWMMKEMDGISLTRLIRNSPKSRNQFIPILMMTGFSEKHRVVQARDAGVTEFLVKPFTARDLYRRIEEIIERPRQYVRSHNFFGPDRRRRNDPKFSGPYRRGGDGNKTNDLAQGSASSSYDQVIVFKNHD